jgi:MHS family alpha-ketoglutarate permease-like MFS transporter
MKGKGLLDAADTVADLNYSLPRHAGKRSTTAILAATLGNMVEWVDWLIYATFAPVFASQFFAPGEPFANLLATFAVFAVGFLMRPIGGAVLGAYADRHGRKRALTLSILLMAGASLAIAVCPTHASIGIAAPAVLVLARLVQGFSAGGEFGSASAFLVESAEPARRAYVGSWQHFALNGGILLASLIGFITTSALSDSSLTTWGWRAGFAFAGALGIVTLWVRRMASETDSFVKMKQAGASRRNPVKVMLQEHPRAALRVAGIAIAGTLFNYLWMVNFPTYAHLRTGVPLKTALLSNALALIVFLVLLPFGGKLSDRFGRKPTLLVFSVGSLLYVWPAFHFMTADFLSLFVIQAIGMILLIGYCANSAAVMAEQFPPEVRVTGIALPYAVSVAVFGGTAPYIVTWMVKSGNAESIWMYLASAALIGTIVYARMPETKGKQLD